MAKREERDHRGINADTPICKFAFCHSSNCHLIFNISVTMPIPISSAKREAKREILRKEAGVR
jgi:hypothetical protein